MHVKISKTGLPLEVKETLNEFEYRDRAWQTRWDWKSFDEVERLSRYLTAMTGKTYLPVDHGPHTGPRFDVMEAPKVGDQVSRGFNGDYYPCGTIVRITKNWMVITSEGRKFNRRRNTAAWVEVGGGPFCLVPGHRDERNPHF